MEFFWYDYETWGLDRIRDRIVQFAGVRTDEDLHPVEEPVNLICKPGLDTPIDPRSMSIHSILPQEAEKEGLPESEFADRVHAELARPGTCSVGFNAMSFDHALSRALFYRNLRDPFRWHWKHGNSKWDILDLLRAVHCLQPDAMDDWPRKLSGKPSFRQGDVARANGVESTGNAHDAAADVAQMVDLARQLKQRAPEIWAHALELRKKRAVENEIDADDRFLLITGRVNAMRLCVTVLRCLGQDPGDTNKKWAFDLTCDPQPLMKSLADWTEEDVVLARRAMFGIKINQAPFVCRPAVAHELMAEDQRGRLSRAISLPPETARKRVDMLQQDAARTQGRPLLAKFLALLAETEPSKRVTTDADEAMYKRGFYSDHQLELMADVLRGGADFLWDQFSSDDPYIPDLVFRYRGRNFPETLSADERARWLQYCRERQFTRRIGKSRSAMDRFDQSLDQLKDPPKEFVDSLFDWRDRLIRDLVQA